jgi:hypothetical protein
MTINTPCCRDVTVVKLVGVDILLQDVVEVATINGLEPSSADFTVDTGEAVGGGLVTTVVDGSVTRSGGPPSTTGGSGSGSSRPGSCLGLRPCRFPGWHEEHTGRWAGGE